MKNQKSILYLLLVVLALILLYNFLIAPILIQNNSGMGMGMHWHMYNNYSYFVDMRIVLILIVSIAGFILFNLIKPQNKSEICSKCGNEIGDKRWRICPLCGTPVNRKGDGK